ncbi:hypothetical protein [Alkalibacterium pelagium]|jgi:cystine transport system permease protein|uniref:Cystine transport system permease protein n=1 Tax=Alkalibacterium pelagium TaxID=426702 RepID=A0A1H7LII6_9LACT|nr:hypothetical protein [Alkalibacterium pelagium]GEN50870.1 hypothetical protein APE02nite_15350 [Alkalibacterium pelagium]SEK98754.1 hypothetical protein SAMN04488099_10993 [Alkalibacterium pelagium]
MEENYIDFYKGKDEEAFLSAWEAEHGKLSEEAIDELYAEIADAVDEAVKKGTHELGEPFIYKNVTVGRSDFNTFHSLYIFEEIK